MIRLTATATAQINDLSEHYQRLGRFEAAERLSRAVRDAIALIGNHPDRGRPYPSTYRDLADRGILWLRVHRYWIGYAVGPDGITITNVHYDASDIPTRIAGRDG